MRLHPAPAVAVVLLLPPLLAAGPPRFEARVILPPQAQHVHSSSIVDLPSGDPFAVYYRGRRAACRRCAA